MLTIFPREVKSFFQTATGYIFMTVYLLLFGLYFTYLNISPTPNNAYTVTLENMVFIFVLLSPLLTMKALSEERKKSDRPIVVNFAKIGVRYCIGKIFCSGLFIFSYIIDHCLLSPYIKPVWTCIFSVHHYSLHRILFYGMYLHRPRDLHLFLYGKSDHCRSCNPWNIDDDLAD